MAAFLVLFRRSLFVAVTSRKSLTTTSNCRLSYSQSLKRYSFDCRRRTLVNWMRYSSDAITWNDISSNELKLMLESKDIQLIDIREPIELIEDGRIESSVNIPCKLLCNICSLKIFEVSTEPVPVQYFYGLKNRLCLNPNH